MRVLHLSADYPDPVLPRKTGAVANLLRLAPGHEHHVWSLNRVPWHHSMTCSGFSDAAGDQHRVLAYPAAPYGISMRRHLASVTNAIVRITEDAGNIPTAVHAHKLSVEGLVGAALAKRWNVPLLLSIQGNSDLKIVAAKPLLRGIYREIWQRAACVLPFAPWAADGLAALLGRRDGPIRMLPCPTTADRLISPVLRPNVICSAFSFRDAANKNARKLIRAVGMAAHDVPDMRLEIAGGGDASVHAQLARLAETHAPGRVTFLGPVPHDAVQAMFNKCAGFAMVSRRESYGMVFAEALLAGTPCLIPRDRALDGYFDDGSVVLTADPGNIAEIGAGLIRLITRQAAMKSTLRALGSSGALDFLRRRSIGETYARTLDDLVPSRQQPVPATRTGPTRRAAATRAALALSSPRCTA
ncbi:MAG: glycosyltransferase family 4 protein [Pseudomonadota bacterium]